MNPPASHVWHTLPAASIAQQLQVDPSVGLSDEQAARRLAEHGANRLPEGKTRSMAAMFFGQFADFMIGVLLVAALISGIAGEPIDTIVIVVIVLLNAVIGFTQEYRAEQAMNALRQLAAPLAHVRRNGRLMTAPAAELVPGDVVLLEAGALVPADLRLIDCARLRIAEATLTGESEPVDKHAAAIDDASLGIADRLNLAYKGTVVAYGRGTGIVVATGLATELGRIATLLSTQESVKTPLQLRLARFGQRLALAVLALCAVIFAAGLVRGEPLLLMFMTAISLAVAAIPEALPAVVAITLAFGAARMVRQQALVRRLPAVETLGSVTWICSDKTGTLTLNRMRVESYWVHGRRHSPAELPHHAKRRGAWHAMHHAMALVNDATLQAGPRPDGASATASAPQVATGEPTEVALLEAAVEAGFAGGESWHALVQNRPRVAELPFDSQRKRMATLHREHPGGRIVAYVKGAPESVLQRCHAQWSEHGTEPFDAGAALEAAEAMAGEGLRVLAFALRRFDALPARHDEAEQELLFLGLVGLMDPPRREAAHAVAECRRAGIVPVMITGDHPSTARAIAERLGILLAGDRMIAGKELAAMSDAQLAECVTAVRVFARMDPEQKIRIVAALQSRGECVAMTGDGVNDAPALKRADIGVAMGRGGTDVAREAADMVLLDDNFSTIVHAVREGRRIFDNIRKFIRYAMTGNSGEIWTIFLAPFLGLPIPLLPIHILWVNLVTDGLPGLALASEPAERGVMQRPPRPPQESVFAGGMWQHIVWVGLLIGAVSLIAQAWAIEHGAPAQSMTFTVLTLAQLAHVMAIRSERDSLAVIGVLSNLPLLLSVLATVALQLSTLYVPALNAAFRTEPLDGGELALCFALAAVVFIGVEIEKWATRRGWIYAQPQESAGAQHRPS
jgi:Ca2+-transporting ATPase